MHRNLFHLINGIIVAAAMSLILAGCGDDGSGSMITAPKSLGKTVTLPVAAVTDTTTKAKVFLGVDDRFTISNSGTSIYGGTGYDIVTIVSGANNVVIDQNVEQINFPGASSSYIFNQTGNLINIYDAAGTTLLAKAPVQGDSDGTILSFSDRLISAQMSSDATIQLYNFPNPQVTIVTSKGTIVVELYPAQAPITVRNFLTYLREGFYANTLFHRVIAGFVVQGGGYTTSGLKQPTHNPITLEAPTATGLTNAMGTIAMARSTDLNSATSQFFFNLVDNNKGTANLDSPTGQGYAVFGSVISGMDVVQQIAATPTTGQTLYTDMVAIISMTRTK